MNTENKKQVADMLRRMASFLEQEIHETEQVLDGKITPAEGHKRYYEGRYFGLCFSLGMISKAINEIEEG